MTALDETDVAALVAAVIDLGQPAVAMSAMAAPRDVSAMVDALDVRETWIYRDWQDAIGEVMLEPSAGSARCYDVKGYRGFMRLSATAESVDGPWLDRLNAFISALDVRADERTDARIKQLRGVFAAVAELIVDFHREAPTRSGISDATLAAAQRTLRAEPATSPKNLGSPQP